jgi:dUTP pyrophosphatase
MIIAAVPKVAYVEVEELDETARGEGGFGHTGKK